MTLKHSGYLRRIANALVGVARETRAAAAVEFAMMLPMLMVLWLGSFDISQALSTDRKLLDTTDELATIVAQYPTVTTSQLNTIMAASSQIMSPYSTTTLGLSITEINTDSNGNGSVMWSQAYGLGQPLSDGSSVTLPSGLASPNGSYILVKGSYRFTPSLGQAFIPRIPPMLHSIYILPRASASIPCSDCT